MSVYKRQRNENIKSKKTKIKTLQSCQVVICVNTNYPGDNGYVKETRELSRARNVFSLQKSHMIFRKSLITSKAEIMYSQWNLLRNSDIAFINNIVFSG